MFNALRQICNHPAFLLKNLRTAEYIDFARCLNAFPPDYDSNNWSTSESGKLQTLAHMVTNFRSFKDKVVIVSQSLQVCLIYYYGAFISILVPSNDWNFVINSSIQNLSS